jgi:hypothetical protein
MQEPVGGQNLHDSRFRANRPLWYMGSYATASHALVRKYQLGDYQFRCSQLGRNVNEHAFNIEQHEHICLLVNNASPGVCSRGTTLLLSIAPPPCGHPVKNLQHSTPLGSSIGFGYHCASIRVPFGPTTPWSTLQRCASSYLCRHRPFIGFDRDTVTTWSSPIARDTRTGDEQHCRRVGAGLAAFCDVPECCSEKRSDAC